MRKIKFRAWDYNAKSMVYLNKLKVQNGEIEYLLTMDKNGEMFVMWQQVTDLPDGKLESSGGLNNLMQYTGLKDKNGIEIYEGDIVNCIECECCGYIGWNDSEAGFYFNILLEDGRYEEEQLYDYVDELEVIGNIYENHELLNVEEQA